MEHSEEYYKLKYFKYKAKYTKQKQAQQNGGGIFGASNIEKSRTTNNAFWFYCTIIYGIEQKNLKKLTPEEKTKIEEEWTEWRNYNHNYQELITKMESLQKNIQNNPTHLEKYNDIMSRLNKNCKNVIFEREAMDKACRIGKDIY